MKLIIACLTIILLFLSCATQTEKETISVMRQPAEFETIEAIWLIWPYADHKTGESVQEVTFSIIDALINDLKVNVTCTDEEHSKKAQSVLKARYGEVANLTIIAFRYFASQSGLTTQNNRLQFEDLNLSFN